jgi:hypothetical protein
LKTDNSCAEAARERRANGAGARHARRLSVSAQAHVAQRREVHAVRGP